MWKVEQMNDTGDQVLDHLPVFSDVTPESRWERLRVQGLVERPLQLVPTAVSGLPVLLGISSHVRRPVYLMERRSARGL